MKMERIQAANLGLIDQVAQQCSALAIGCADAGGGVAAVSESLCEQIGTLADLQSVMASLEADQRSVADATDEARMLSDSARRRLAEGGATITRSIAEFAEITALVARLGTQITSFASALEQVRRTTEVIGAIARTTNMLALNAAIEAERAGHAGRTFAVVAAEVKKLARDTREATDDIAATMASLTSEADTFVREVAQGAMRGRNAEQGFARINETVVEVTDLVAQVDGQTDGIARAASVIDATIGRVGDALDGFARLAVANNERLTGSLAKIGALEDHASVMLDTLVHSGFTHHETPFVEGALALARELEVLIDKAITDGVIAADAVFDTNYQLIEDSDPPQYTTGFSDFADIWVRPLLDRAVAGNAQVVGVSLVDMECYLPTHITLRSKPQRRGDPAWNALNSRNRRKLPSLGRMRARHGEQDFFVHAYRQDLGVNGFVILKNVSVPISFAGRPWGNVELGYTDRQSAPDPG